MRSLALIVAVLFCGTAFAQQTVPDPADSSKPYLSVFTHSDYAARPAETELIRNMQSGRLVQFARGCHFKHYTDEDPIYRNRFSDLFPVSTFPVVCVQRSDGAYWYKASGSRIPRSADALLEEIEFYIKLDPALDTQTKEQICPPGGCPPNEPRFPPQDEPRFPLFRPTEPELPTLPDSSDLLKTDAPIRDALSNMAWIGFAIIASLFLLFVVALAAIVLAFVTPRN